MICLLARIKKTDLFKTQIVNYMYFEYEKKRFLKANRASV